MFNSHFHGCVCVLEQTLHLPRTHPHHHRVVVTRRYQVQEGGVCGHAKNVPIILIPANKAGSYERGIFIFNRVVTQTSVQNLKRIPN